MNRLPNALVGDENTRKPAVSSLRLSRHERKAHMELAVLDGPGTQFNDRLLDLGLGCLCYRHVTLLLLDSSHDTMPS
jgi:hypothetical protein